MKAKALCYDTNMSTPTPTLTEMHHALVVGGLSDRVPQVLAYLAERGCTRERAQGDLLVQSVQSFGIDDARALSDFVILKPIVLPRRVAVVFAVRITVEAQQALLKTFEEPRGAAIILIVPQPELLLPTLQSRLLPLILGTDSKETTTHEEARAFLALSTEKRLAHIQNLVDGARGDDQNLAALAQFLHSLERALAPSVTTKEGQEGIRALYRAARAIHEPGAPMKPLLEQVAFLVPTHG
jgi:hypothetical protein